MAGRKAGPGPRRDQAHPGRHHAAARSATAGYVERVDDAGGRRTRPTRSARIDAGLDATWSSPPTCSPGSCCCAASFGEATRLAGGLVDPERQDRGHRRRCTPPAGSAGSCGRLEGGHLRHVHDGRRASRPHAGRRRAAAGTSTTRPPGCCCPGVEVIAVGSAAGRRPPDLRDASDDPQLGGDDETPSSAERRPGHASPSPRRGGELITRRRPARLYLALLDDVLRRAARCRASTTTRSSD